MPFKMTIIGAGPGGYVAALRAAQKGALVTIVEEDKVGGTCLNRGCIPTKTLIASAEALNQAKRADDFGLECGAVSYNLAKIRERKDKVVFNQVKGILGLFKSWGVSLIEGRGTILSNECVRVDRADATTEDIPSDRIIIATGSRPAMIAGFPFDGETVITSDDAVRLHRIPKSIIIVGAGVIGSEFAFIYRSFGAEVTMLEMFPRALSTEDEEISALIEREFKKAKIKLITGVKVDMVEKDAGGMVFATLNNGKRLTAEMVLVSIGRSMNTENIGLESVGVRKGVRGEIIVNDKMETDVPGIYAIGDVTGKMLLAHVASHQGLVAVENALGGDDSMSYDVVPTGIFTMPEVGSVGLREKQAIEQGISVSIGRFPYRALGKAHAMGEITGLVKVIADKNTDKIVGVHICGAHATDIIHEGAVAIEMGVTVKDLGRMIHAHPTLSEAMMEACEDVHKTAIHVTKSEK
jgi:dihydrolipoamide dehydrogenase